MKTVASVLGLAAKAGRLLTGSAAVEEGIRHGRAQVVICANDLSAKTIKNFKFLCEQKTISFFTYGMIAELGHWIGAPGRGVIAVTSNDFSKMICSLLKDGGEEP